MNKKPRGATGLACALVFALALCLLPAQAVAAPEDFSGVDFSNGNIAFLQLDHARRGTSPDFQLELAEFDGAPAVKVAAVGGKIPWIGISASTLLAPEDLPKVETVVLQLGLKSHDERFWPLTGSIWAYTGAELAESATKFGVQTPESNPKLVYSKLAAPLAADAHNYILLAPSQDDGSAYVGKSDLYILGLGFRDAQGAYLPINADAGADFPEGYDVVQEAAATETVELKAGPLEANWNNFNSSDGSVPLEVWQRAVALVVEYAPREDGTSPLDTNADAGKFVIQVVGGPQEQGWHEVPLGDPLVTQEAGQRITLTLDDMDQVTEVQNLGLGVWDGNDTITSMALVCVKGIETAELATGPLEANWNNFNSTDGKVPLETWQKAKALVIEYAPREDGTSPLDTNADAGKFVIQVLGGPQEQGWHEVTLSDPAVEIETGASITLYLDDMDQVTEVQNLGFGVWDGNDTVTRVYLILN